MSQFDVHELRSGYGLVVDCQVDLLSHLSTRFVVPLLRADDAPLTDKRLRPRFNVGGEVLVMTTPLASSLPARELGAIVGSLKLDSHLVIGAIDVLAAGI